MDFLDGGRPITLDEACALQQLLFGDTEFNFGLSWTRQAFKFRGEPEPYGLIQYKSGPCGVIASVQAHVIYELLYGFGRNTLINKRLRPNCKEKQEALARAITSILWQAGENKRAILAIKTDALALNLPINIVLRQNGVLEYLKLINFHSKDCLLNYLFNFITTLMVNNSGSCVTLLYSVCLTRGIDKIKQDMDYQNTILVGDDGFCSQEIVNLILVGRASSNAFNGDHEFNLGGEETTVLRGILGRTKIGFLSEYDGQEMSTVGTFYRYPTYPIWVIFGGHHYTVLFATSREIFDFRKANQAFELYYIDCIAFKTEETSFSLVPLGTSPIKFQPDVHHIFKCIQARWPHAELLNVTRRID